MRRSLSAWIIIVILACAGNAVCAASTAVRTDGGLLVRWSPDAGQIAAWTSPESPGTSHPPARGFSQGGASPRGGTAYGSGCRRELDADYRRHSPVPDRIRGGPRHARQVAGDGFPGDPHLSAQGRRYGRHGLSVDEPHGPGRSSRPGSRFERRARRADAPVPPVRTFFSIPKMRESPRHRPSVPQSSPAVQLNPVIAYAPAAPKLRIKVSRDGLYRLDYAYLVDHGFPRRRNRSREPAPDVPGHRDSHRHRRAADGVLRRRATPSSSTARRWT